MDYKKLVEQLRSASPLHGSWLRDRMEEAATAIETLLAERDAAAEDLTKICEDNPDTCQYCKHMPCTGKHDRCIGWKWRGPQKGESNDQAKL